MKKAPSGKLKLTKAEKAPSAVSGYDDLLGDISTVIDAGRRQAVWSINAIMSAVYWDIGRRIVHFEQGGRDKAAYGEKVIDQLSADLSARFGRGFKRSNLFQIRAFFLAYRGIVQTPSGQLPSQPAKRKVQTLSGQLAVPTSQGLLSISQPPAGKTLGPYLAELMKAFPLPCSHYVRLLSTRGEEARRFYETEALRSGWSLCELDRQISSLLYERLALSRNKAALLRKAEGTGSSQTEADEELRDPFILEFLNFRDEYSESDLEDSLVQHLSQFLDELGHDFCFVGRQRRLRVGGEWYRADLIFCHRKLRCLVIIDLKATSLPTPMPARCISTSTTPASTGSSPAKARPHQMLSLNQSSNCSFWPSFSERSCR